MTQPLLIEIIGEPGVGKTHLSLTFPKPFLIDTSPKYEAKAIARKVLGEGWEKRYHASRDLREIVQILSEVLDRDDVATVIIDTGADLQSLGAKEYLRRKREAGKERAQVTQIEYGRVRDLIDDEVINYVIRHDKNLILTAQTGDT